ncbi:hypothetical protein [Croceicoccus naphthovorans]|uniref:Uncharacterized protein n=1 Tax=Croceicoccus naphthovorans TaxID=1348774 RepID=A0A0G3XFE0_9SPHN|nr:hypothetical protein [Croceicoccus naphthovorans]AKM09927.1 hypothetical protein AB433_07950 [Croceicoccus naphthovorans]MBB3990924.1 hypothetical protein [Croceicoccus naphthovorans]
MPWGRLIKRELVPVLALLLLWGTVLIQIGPRALALVIAVHFCANAAQGISAIATVGAVRRRRAAAPEIFRATRLRAWILEGASLVGGLVALGLIALLYVFFEERELVPLIAMIALGFPARYNGPLRARGFGSAVPRVVRSWSAAIMVPIVLLIWPTAEAAVLALAAREWVTTITLALWREKPPTERQIERTEHYVPAWREFLTLTASLSMRRFFYHASHSILHFVVGPFGSAVARASRGMGYLRRVSEVRQMKQVVSLASVGGLGGTVLLLWLVPGPGSLALSSLLLRLGALATSATIWTYAFPAAAAGSAGEDSADDD